MSEPEEFTLRSDVTVELVKQNASDDDVIWAARVSTLGERADIGIPEERRKGLINFLMREKHGTPFEHNSMTFLISAPIFVFREFHRHRVGWSYNEASGRYMELAPVFYVPGENRRMIQEGKPGNYTFLPGPKTMYGQVYQEMAEAYHRAYAHYTALLAKGVAKEMARAVLPVGLFSHMYATCNARSLMSFLALRTEDERATFPSHPQQEIEMVARSMEDVWSLLMPLTYEAFNKHGRVSP